MLQDELSQLLQEVENRLDQEAEAFYAGLLATLRSKAAKGEQRFYLTCEQAELLGDKRRWVLMSERLKAEGVRNRVHWFNDEAMFWMTVNLHPRKRRWWHRLRSNLPVARALPPAENRTT